MGRENPESDRLLTSQKEFLGYVDSLRVGDVRTMAFFDYLSEDSIPKEIDKLREKQKLGKITPVESEQLSLLRIKLGVVTGRVDDESG